MIHTVIRCSPSNVFFFCSVGDCSLDCRLAVAEDNTSVPLVLHLPSYIVCFDVFVQPVHIIASIVPLMSEVVPAPSAPSFALFLYSLLSCMSVLLPPLPLAQCSRLYLIFHFLVPSLLACLPLQLGFFGCCCPAVGTLTFALSFAASGVCSDIFMCLVPIFRVSPWRCCFFCLVFFFVYVRRVPSAIRELCLFSFPRLGFFLHRGCSCTFVSFQVLSATFVFLFFASGAFSSGIPSFVFVAIHVLSAISISSCCSACKYALSSTSTPVPCFFMLPLIVAYLVCIFLY